MEQKFGEDGGEGWSDCIGCPTQHVAGDAIRSRCGILLVTGEELLNLLMGAVNTGKARSTLLVSLKPRLVEKQELKNLLSRFAFWDEVEAVLEFSLRSAEMRSFFGVSLW